MISEISGEKLVFEIVKRIFQLRLLKTALKVNKIGLKDSIKLKKKLPLFMV